MLLCVGCSRPKPKVIVEGPVNVIGNALLSLVGEEVDDIARDCQAELRDETWAGQHLDFALRFDAEGRPQPLAPEARSSLASAVPRTVTPTAMTRRCFNACANV